MGREETEEKVRKNEEEEFNRAEQRTDTLRTHARLFFSIKQESRRSARSSCSFFFKQPSGIVKEVQASREERGGSAGRVGEWIEALDRDDRER